MILQIVISSKYFLSFCQYTARLRLPQSMKQSEKLNLVDKLIEDLYLTECQHTGKSRLSSLCLCQY